MTNTPFGWRRPAPAEPLDIAKLIAQWDAAVATLFAVQEACQSIPRVVNINDPDKPSWFPLGEATADKVEFIEECDLGLLVGPAGTENLPPHSETEIA
jgi:hypothetical protein